MDISQYNNETENQQIIRTPVILSGSSIIGFTSAGSTSISTGVVVLSGG